ncbi:MAG: radical SAM protein [Thermodesulfobacteriota bacterium]
MAFFSHELQKKLARSLVTKSRPLYVQYYITARCNHYCEQCNIVYAQADAPEMNIRQIRAMAENLAEIGVCIVLLIGGEPFVRRDLPEIIKAFVDNGIHVRMQTNGLASRAAMRACIEAGGHDISISLDSLDTSTQDTINGMPHSFERTLKAVAMVSELFPQGGQGFFGTVLMPRNLEHLAAVVEFATRIGWWVSLVPCHVTTPDQPRGFRSFDDDGVCAFPREKLPRLRQVLDELKVLRRGGKHLYDCDEYLDDIYRFLADEPTRWRRRNHGVCDSPNLYFAIEPNGNIQPCCDYKIGRDFPVHAPDFVRSYRSGEIHEAISPFTATCPGCMYGSYPEITLTARFLRPMFHRMSLFNRGCGLARPFAEPELRRLAAKIMAGFHGEGRS